jgi:hypothetical protein
VSHADSYVYYNTWKMKTMIGIHVDDGLACSVDKTELDKIVKHLEREFDVKTRAVDCYVGFQVETNICRSKIFINQSRYILDILDRFNMLDCHPVETSVDSKFVLSKSQGDFDYEVEVNIPYKKVAGSLIYTSVISRPDILFAVSDVAHYSKNPRRSHWMAVKRIFRYLKGTINFGTLYSGSKDDLIVKGFCNADFANDTINKKSRT